MKDNLDYIEELKNDFSEGLMIENNSDLGYKIRIVYRGEGLFYFDRKLDKALICDIQIRNGSIFKKTIKKWDDKTNVENVDEVLNRICNYFITYQKIEPFIR